ncbi:hypothetical protein D7X94_11715 [Acutalibacter sp. 1XD8-33]|uniref:stage III sporulation protein AB n=1 Tax=Acutalibacter sp. 1XD8-33 TaxID=2320081 RepID=UPI000EA17BE2|nr:stage III sporulation protein AB [Acutalibacter sp. 1XD8-33]RKJ39622.1 hypothetical protein D7X94_11715 [Acutalibacter sp. 1XD8-33]
MRLLGGILLVLSGLCWGLGEAGRLSRRARLLTEFQQLMQALRTEISYSSRPLGEIISKSESRFCREAADRPEFRRNPAEALARTGEELLRNPKDRQLFRDFAQGLGASDTQGQIEHLRLHMALGEENLREAREECREKRRLYIALGLFGGLAACIVVM